MILHTSGSVDVGPDLENIYFLGPWCTADGNRPFETSLDISNETDLDIVEFSNLLVRELESVLYPAVNQFHNIHLHEDVWRYSLGTYLRVLAPLVVTRYNLVRRAVFQRGCDRYTNLEIKKESVTPNDRTQLQALVNSHLWNQFVFEEICATIGLKPTEGTRINEVEQVGHNVHLTSSMSISGRFRRFVQKLFNSVAKRTRIVITQTMLPFPLDLNVALSCFSVPFFWQGDASYSAKIDGDAREQLLAQVETSDEFQMMFRKIVIRTLPKLFVEDFSRIRSRTKSLLPRSPKVVFTSNLHMASDQFLLWLSEMRLSNTQIIIGQHGGVHCLARDLPVEASIEFALADRYLAWGEFATQLQNGVKSPVLATAQKTMRRSRDRNSVVVILDSPYRYPSMPRGFNGNRYDYASVLNHLLSSRFLSYAEHVVLRFYAGAERFDGPLHELINSHPRVVFDNGHQPLEELLERAKLVISTSIGTSIFKSIRHDIPTMLILDPRYSCLSQWAEDHLTELRSASILFSLPEDLVNHFVNISTQLDEWWTSPETLQAKQVFRDLFFSNVAPTAKFYKDQIRLAAKL